MNNNERIKITKEKRIDMIRKIKKYFLDERDEDLGDLASGMVLDFFIKELAVEFYNQGIHDSYEYMNEKCEDLLSIQK